MWMLWLIYIIVFIGFAILAWKKPGLALILLLPVAAAMVFSGLVDINGHLPDGAILPISLGIMLLPISISIIHWGPSSSQLEAPWYKSVTTAILTLFMYILILALFCFVFQFFGPILFIIFIIGVIEFNKARRFGLIIDTISAIGTSMRQSLPLPTALTAAAYGQNRKCARTLNNIVYWLTQGQPLSEALKRGYPKCPSYILGSIAAAEKIDQLPEAIQSLEADMAEKTARKMTSNTEHVLYPLVVLTAAFTIVMALAVFIVPTFSEVLYDMSDGEAHLPASTQSLLNMSGWLTGGHGTNALLVFLLAVFIILFVLYIQFRKRNPEKPRMLSCIGDQIKWMSPVLHWFEKTHSTLILTESLRIGFHAGYPLNTILRHALGLDINSCYRNRIKQWLVRIEAGQDISQSARGCGIDKPLAWALDDKINKGNTPQILEGLEEVYRCKYNYRRNVLIAASEPVMILLLGLAVGYVVYSMFMGGVSILLVTLQYTIPQ